MSSCLGFYITALSLLTCKFCSSESGFILTAPKRLLAGSAESVCVSLHNVTGVANVSLSLLHADTDEAVASTNHLLKNSKGSCMELVIPPTLITTGRLHLKILFEDRPTYTVNAVKEVHIQQDPLLIFVETDKPVYKPGQTVLFRILTLRNDLKPVTDPIYKIWLESPSEVRLAQWSNVTTENGLAQLQFQLSPEPLQGVWKIKVEHGEQYQTTQVSTFQVKEYVLPRFQVTIRPPDYILADAEYVQWKICAKFSYGQPVNGDVHIKAVPMVPAWRQRKAKPVEIHSSTKLNGTDGCIVFNVTGKELGLPDWDIAPSNIAVTATVTEEGTQTSQNSTTSTAVLHQALKLDFLHYSPQYFKPGLPYKGKVRVLLQNDVPAPKELIQLCLKVQGKGEWSRTLVACQNFTSEADGFVHFVVPPQHENIVLLSFVATAVEYTTKYYSPDKRWRVYMDQPTAFFDIQSWYSPSKSYILIAEDIAAPKCKKNHQLNIYYTAEPNITSRTFHYIVKSRGDIILFGQVEHQQEEESLTTLYGYRNNVLGGADGNSVNGNSSSGEDVDGSSVNKLPLRLFIRPKMSPVSYLMVYYTREDGEIVAATHVLNIEKCFLNKVSAVFSENEKLPGSDVDLKISASSPSICAVTAIDESANYLASPSLIDGDSVFRNLARFHIDPNSVPRQKDEWNRCSTLSRDSSIVTTFPPLFDIPDEFLPLRRKRSIMSAPPSRYADSIQAFDDFGVVVMTDLTLETRPCVLPRRAAYEFMPDTRRSRIRSKVSTAVMESRAPLAYPLVVGVNSNRRVYTEESQKSAVELRNYFPETWLWDLVHVEGELTMTETLPHTITTWTGSVLCLSSEKGLGISPPINVKAFQPFFLDYTVPYAIKRGEVVTLKVSLFNYLNVAAPVRILLEDSPGVEVITEDWYLETCVDETSQFVQEFQIRAYRTGEINITVSGEVDPGINLTCGNYVNSYIKDRITKPLLIKAEGFPMEVTSTSFICPSESSNSTSVTWNLTLPADVVKDSARAEVTAVGDLLGPTLQNLDSLVKLPMGCGEQNMILFVPNIHVLNYLIASKQENPVLYAKAVEHMNKGYQRELTYQHQDGSYSAFGSADSTGSMWLTAFVVKSFAQARDHIFIDEEDLNKSIRWITKKQLENGCFPVVGQVFHADIKGGLTGEPSSAALTAYVLISLLETKFPLPSSVTSNAIYCLRGDSEPDIYTLALSTYALTLLGQKQLAEEFLRHLVNSATAQRDLIWWEKPDADSLALNVEITSYAVLSLVEQGGEENLITALKAVRWISKQRNPSGGFVSTQDTVVALEALTKYASRVPMADPELTVLVITSSFERAVNIEKSNRLLLHTVPLPDVPSSVEVVAEGEGCVLVQCSLKYNVNTATGSDAFELEVETGPVASVDECTLQRVEACVRYKIEGEASNMAVLEVAMVTGYSPDRASLHKLSQNTELDLKRWEEEKDQVNFYFEQLTSRRQCVGFLVVQEVLVDNPAPAVVKLYDYYHRELSVTSKYSTDVGCKGEKLPHPEPDTLAEETSFVSDENAEIFYSKIARIYDDADSNDDTNNSKENANNNTEPLGLNPDFVIVNEELETPLGQEGPVPVYVDPQEEIVTASGSVDGDDDVLCPHCNEVSLEEFNAIYCNSSTVFKIALRRKTLSRVAMNLSPNRIPVRLWKPIRLGLRRRCKCAPLEQIGVRVLLLTSKTVFLNRRTDGPTDIPLDGTYYVQVGSSDVGEPDIVRDAREKCSELKTGQ